MAHARHSRPRRYQAAGGVRVRQPAPRGTQGRRSGSSGSSAPSPASPWGCTGPSRPPAGRREPARGRGRRARRSKATVLQAHPHAVEGRACSPAPPGESSSAGNARAVTDHLQFPGERAPDTEHVPVQPAQVERDPLVRYRGMTPKRMVTRGRHLALATQRAAQRPWRASSSTVRVRFR